MECYGNQVSDESFCLPSVEMLELEEYCSDRFYPDYSFRLMFPNIRHLKLYFSSLWYEISDHFPQLTTLELIDRPMSPVYISIDTLADLPDLQHLAVRNMLLAEDSSLPTNLEQITLMNSTLDVPRRMAQLQSHLRFLNMIGHSQCTNLANLPSACLIRRNVPNKQLGLIEF